MPESDRVYLYMDFNHAGGKTLLSKKCNSVKRNQHTNPFLWPNVHNVWIAFSNKFTPKRYCDWICLWRGFRGFSYPMFGNQHIIKILIWQFMPPGPSPFPEHPIIHSRCIYDSLLEERAMTSDTHAVNCVAHNFSEFRFLDIGLCSGTGFNEWIKGNVATLVNFRQMKIMVTTGFCLEKICCDYQPLRQWGKTRVIRSRGVVVRKLLEHVKDKSQSWEVEVVRIYIKERKGLHRRKTVLLWGT